jgi:exosome complex component RRP4
VKVFPSLVKRCKTHFHNLPCDASIILGNNGFIWISATVNDGEQNGLGGFTENLKEVRHTLGQCLSLSLKHACHSM